MGQQDYLVRAALGRSAFADGATRLAENGSQQYDAKGRPVKPETEQLDRCLRNAMNDVLALTPVVERKERDEQQRMLDLDDARRQLLLAEDNTGEMLTVLLAPFHVLRIWPMTIFQRVVIGYYDPSIPFASILASEIRSVWHEPLAHVFPAAGAMILSLMIKFPLTLAIQEAMGRFQEFVGIRISHRRTSRALHGYICWIASQLLDSIDILLFPLDFHIMARRLGLAPAQPHLPSYKFFLPLHASSFHSFAWRPIISVWFLGALISPASLMLISNIIHNATDAPAMLSSLDYPAFEEPKIDAEPKRVPAPRLLHNPLGWTMYRAWLLRRSFLEQMGWSVVRPRPLLISEFEMENNILPTVVPNTNHRSTNLAHKPAKTLAYAVDSVLMRLMMLPLHSILWRVLAASYMSSTLPKTHEALAAASHMYKPFGGPLLRGSWAAAGSYLSRLGLAIALGTCMDALLFTGFYSVTRSIGIKLYGWGTKSTTEMLKVWRAATIEDSTSDAAPE